MNDDSFLGRGWAFPPVFEKSSMRLLMTAGEDNVNQSIDLLLKTPRGSRSLKPAYGSDLFRFMFRRIDASLQQEIIESVKTTLLNNEPRIVVENVSVTLDDGGAMVAVTVDYIISRSNSRHNHVFPFSLLEGTNLQLGA